MKIDYLKMILNGAAHAVTYATMAQIKSSPLSISMLAPLTIHLVKPMSAGFIHMQRTRQPARSGFASILMGLPGMSDKKNID